MATKSFNSGELKKALFLHSKKMNLDLGLVMEHIDVESFDETWLEVFTKTHMCTTLASLNRDWILLAGKVYMDLMSKFLPKTLLESTLAIEPFLDAQYVKFIRKNHAVLETMINYDRDFEFTLPAILTVGGSYLMKRKDGETLRTFERPQHMYMRVAIWDFFPHLDNIRLVYDALSTHRISVATPHYCNAATKKPNLMSCYLKQVQDSTLSIGEDWLETSLISKNGGGLGKDFSNLRIGAISNTGVASSNITWYQISDKILEAFPQGGKRKGSATANLVSYHPGIFDFIEAKSRDPPHEARANENLTYCIAYNEYILKKIREGKEVYLISPHIHTLNKKFGKEFVSEYKSLVRRIKNGEKLPHTVVPARSIHQRHAHMAAITGGPFSFFKENVNRQSNTLRYENGVPIDGRVDHSNLCMEIVEPTEEGISSCNLSSINLTHHITDGKLDVGKLKESMRIAVMIGDRAIERTYYFDNEGKEGSCIPSIEYMNKKYRPLAIGIQGLADLAAELDYTWFDENFNLTPEIVALNETIAREMYLAGVEKTHELALQLGSFPAYEGTPASYGLTMPDLFVLSKLARETGIEFSDYQAAYDYLVENDLLDRSLDGHRQKLRTAMRNCLMVSYMPTANTATILDNNECFEMFSGLFYTRKVLNGVFTYINRHLQRDFMAINCYTPELVKHIMTNDSIQGLDMNLFPREHHARIEFLKRKYLTVYEGKQKQIIDLAAVRQKYICQAQSTNLYFAEPSLNHIAWSVLYAEQVGLKTLYYARVKTESGAKNYSAAHIETLFTKNRAKYGTGEICEGCVL